MCSFHVPVDQTDSVGIYPGEENFVVKYAKKSVENGRDKLSTSTVSLPRTQAPVQKQWSEYDHTTNIFCPDFNVSDGVVVSMSDS